MYTVANKFQLLQCTQQIIYGLFMYFKDSETNQYSNAGILLGPGLVCELVCGNLIKHNFIEEYEHISTI